MTSLHSQARPAVVAYRLNAEEFKSDPSSALSMRSQRLSRAHDSVLASWRVNVLTFGRLLH